MRVILVTPPVPGRRPRVTSGRPSWMDGSSSAIRQCAQSAISQPPPSAAPSSAATTGMPRVSRARIGFLTSSSQWNTAGPWSGPNLSTSFSSAPAKKVFLPEARITPVIDDFSRARRGKAVAQLAALQLVDQGAEDHRAGRAERVAHGDRAAVDVHDFVGNVHFLHELHRYHGEGLVDLEEI